MVRNLLCCNARCGLIWQYIVWQIYENRLDWFKLEEGRYIFLEPDADGVIRSAVFPGLWLALPALQQGNFAVVLGVGSATGLANRRTSSICGEIRG